jgi:orotate phosphoribosyltransferase
MTADATADVRATLKATGAWLEGHFLLHSGRHSDQFIQMAQAFQYPEKANALCAALGEKLKPFGARVVVGPAVGGILMAYAVGHALGIRALYTEKQGGAHRLGRGFRIEPGELVVVVDDVSTTGDSVRQAMAAARDAGGTVVAAGLIVDRSGGTVRLARHRENEYLGAGRVPALQAERPARGPRHPTARRETLSHDGAGSCEARRITVIALLGP